MTSRASPQITYAVEDDVLYISISSSKYGYTKEGLPWVFWRYDINDDNLIGVTIMEFSNYWGSNLDDLAKALANNLGISKKKVFSFLPKPG